MTPRPNVPHSLKSQDLQPALAVWDGHLLAKLPGKPAASSFPSLIFSQEGRVPPEPAFRLRGAGRPTRRCGERPLVVRGRHRRKPEGCVQEPPGPGPGGESWKMMGGAGTGQPAPGSSRPLEMLMVSIIIL